MNKNLSEVVAVYFPSYHPDALYEQWYSPGWSEWRLLEQMQPLFPGHEQPKLCTWGSFDESDPKWMEKQIDLAADHGITTFLFDWYWYNGQKFLHRALEDGFLKARNRHRLKFYIMWANHTWGVFPACRDVFRGPTGFERQIFGQALAYDKPLLEIRHSLEDLENATRYCIEHYMHEPNYLHVDGQPLFSFWHWPELEEGLGGEAGVRAGLDRMRTMTREAGFKGLHISANIANYEGPETHLCWWPSLTERMKRCGVDSVYGYNVARTPGFAALTNDRPLVPYDDVIQSHRDLFARCENRGLPFFPVATIGGCDNSPRWRRGETFPVDFRKLGYEPIVVGSTPEKFGQTVQAALDCIARADGPRHLLLNGWNEWTEGNYLLPDQWHGTGYLEALRKAVCR
ncbi:MAG: glycoside hydrolase family 99-like domain-containing protein [Phycisphaeraceae bacterium]|nr:glycoside hydrolase family 99-like domain-containing protein [Phycisphaeraceae bacterium]